jgi:5-methylcytosine-specific restriction endonuclease McrA
MATYGSQFQKNKKKVAELNLEKYGEYTCEICKRAPLFKGTGDQDDRAKELAGVLLTIDHLIPIGKGGKNGLYNLQVSCNKCNQEKGCE